MTHHTPLVNFLIAGVQKGGTTILDNYLRQHPNIGMANTKEVHFFDNENLFKTDNIDYSRYHNAFSPSPQHLLFGESTPIYTYWKNSASRIFNYNPNMKLIILLRNPVERAFSHWNKERINFHSYPNQTTAAETLSFYDAITSETERCHSTFPLQHRYYSYIDRGLYYQQLSRLLKFFPMEQLLVIKSEWLKTNTKRTLEKISYFLNIPPHQYEIISSNTPLVCNEKNTSPVDSPIKSLHNSGSYSHTLSQDEKLYLINAFKEDITKLETLLNWDCNDWLI